MASVTDELITRLSVAGGGGYASEFRAAAASVQALSGSLEGAGRAQSALALGAGVLGIGVFRELGRAAKAAGEDAANFERASGNFRGQFPIEDLQRFAGGLSQLTGIEDDVIASTTGLLGTFRLTRSQAEQLTPAIYNAAEALKAQGVTADQLAVQVGKAIEGGMVQSLRRSGIFVDEVRFKTDRLGAVLDALNAQGGNAAERFRNTLPGAMQAAQSALHDFQEALGAPLLGPMQAAANTVARLAHAFTELPGPLQTLATVGLGALGIGLTVYSAQTVIALNNTIRLAEAELFAASAARAHAAAAGSVTRAVAAQGAAARVTAGAIGGTAAAGAYTTTAGTSLGGAAATAGAAGLATRLGGFLRGPGGIATVIAGELALNALPDEGIGGRAKRIGGAALGGAGAGGFVGSAFGPLGTLIGAAVGALAGGGFAAAGEKGQTAGGGSVLQRMLDEAQKTNQLLQKQLDQAKILGRGEAFDTGEVPGSWQAASALGRLLA